MKTLRESLQDIPIGSRVRVTSEAIVIDDRIDKRIISPPSPSLVYKQAWEIEILTPPLIEGGIYAYKSSPGSLRVYLHDALWFFDGARDYHTAPDQVKLVGEISKDFHFPGEK